MINADLTSTSGEVPAVESINQQGTEAEVLQGILNYLNLNTLMLNAIIADLEELKDKGT